MSTYARFTRFLRRKVFAAFAILLIGFSSGPAVATTFYWDTDGSDAGNATDGTGLGGSGTWDTSALRWWDGLNPLNAWLNGSDDTAVFTYAYPALGIPSNFGVTVAGGGVTTGNVSFLRSGYTLSGGAITLAGSAPTLHANLGESATISSNLLGTGGLTKTGGGAIRLTGDNSGLSGTTTIANGTLIINSALALPGTGAVSILTANMTPLNTTLYGFGGGSLVLDGTGSGFTISRDINLEGRGPIGERGAALISVGDNTVSGTVSTAVSPLPLSPTATIRNSRVNSVNGTLSLSGTLNVGGTSASTFTNLGGINSAGTGNFDLTGVLAGTGSIEKSGGGTLFLNPSSTSGFSGTVRISSSNTGGQESTIRVTQATVGGTSIFGTNTVSGDDPSAIDMNGGVLEFRSEGDLDFNSLSSGKNVYQRANSTMFAGPGVGGQGINGTVTLGTYRVASNTTANFNSRNGYGFTFQTWSQENSNSNFTINNDMGGTLLFTGNAWNNSDGSARTLTMQGDGNTIITGSINSSGAGLKTLTKNDIGTLTINGTATTLDGPVNITNGEVVVRDFRSINDNTATINLGSGTNTVGLIIGTDQAASAAGLDTNKVINLSGTTGGAHLYANQTGANPVILASAFTATGAGAKTLFLGGTSTVNNAINGAIVNSSAATSLTKLGSGTWQLGGTNTFTGNITIANGTLKLKANAAASTIVTDTVGVTFNQSNEYTGGTLEFVGQDGVNNVENLGALTLSNGANTLRLTPGTGGTASLVFSSLAAPANASSLNIVGSDATNTVTLTGVATGLAGAGHLFFNGSDFAYSDGGVIRAPVYGSDSGFVNAPAGTALPNTLQDSFSINGDITAQPTQIVDTLKFNGSQTLTLASGATITVRTGGSNTDGGVLVTGGNAVVTGGTSFQGHGSGTLVIRVDGAFDTLTLQTPIGGGTDGIEKNGAGTLVIGGANAQTGITRINEGTVQLSGGGILSAANQQLSIRQAGTLDLNGVSTGNAIGNFVSNGVITNSNATAATLTVGNNNGTGTSRGIIQDGLGVVNVTKVGTGAQSWLGLSTYTGVTTIGSTGLVTVNYLADIGQDSGIGRGVATDDATNAASLVFNGSTGGLVYQGDRIDGNLTVGDVSASTNRLFTLAGTGARLSSTVGLNNGIIWSNTGAIVHGVVGPQLITFEGTSAGDNTFNPQLTDSGTGTDITSVTKTGTGQWVLGNANNTYTGTTTVANGVLALKQSGALPADSPVVLGSTTTGILQMSGTFARNLTATPTAGTGTITWGGTTGGGGFAAHATPLTVTLNGGAGLTWGSGGFVGSGGTQTLVFGSTSALSDVTFTNDIDLGADSRTVSVIANTQTGADFATLDGNLSGAGGALTKTGNGVLRLGGSNSYTGTTQIQSGTVTASSLGSSSGPSTSSVGAGGVAMNDGNAIVLGNATTTGGVLQYVGAGETSDRKIRLRGTTAGNQIHADGSGPLILTNVAHDTTETGNKTLSLRGSNTAGNMITSALTNNGAGVLSVSIDGAATWILTNPGNTYTGTTTVGAGAIGIGHDNALGTGTLVFSNANSFAYGGDRTIANAVNHNNNATAGFLGDYNLTFTQPLNWRAAANNMTTSNSVTAGKTVTFAGGVTNTEMTANRTWTFGGNGETVINGNFTTTTGFGASLSVAGNGILNLGTTGATSNWNQNNASIDVDRGTLKFSANNAIPTAAATNGGLILSPELATADTATLDLNGTTQTINSLTMNTDGTAIIDNTSALAATLRFGANDTAASIGGGIGSYTITDSGAGALSLVKLGNTSTTIPTGVTLTYQGTTAVEGGTFTIASPVNGTSALSVTNSGSTLALTGGITTPSAITSVVVENGATLSLLDGAGNKLNGLTNLQLGSSVGTMTTLNLNVGDQSGPGDELFTDTLTLLTGGTLGLFSGNQITFNLTDIGLNPMETYELLNFADGGFTAGPLLSTDYLLGATPGGFDSFTLTATNTSVFVTTGNLIIGTSYWRGLTNNTWNAAANNWSSDKAGTTPALSIPGAGTDVIFAWDNPGSGPLTTTLEQNFKVNSLTFEAGGTTTPSSVIIAPGAVTTNRIEVAPQSAADGIEISTGGPSAVTISGPVRLGGTATSQTWNVADAGSVLSLGSLLGERDVTKTGAGKVTLTSAADPTFNTGVTADFTINAGTLEITDVSALGNPINSNVANVTVNSTGAFFYNGAASTATNLAMPLTLNGGTLSAGAAGQTYSGAVNISGNSFINLRDSNSATLTTTQRDITLSGVLSGSGDLTLDSINTASSGNQITGNLIISNPGNSGWSGDLNILRGSVIARTGNADALGSGAINIESGKIEWEGAGGSTYVINKPLTIASSTGNAVGEWNIDRTSGTGTFKVTNTAPLTLGSSAGTGELRIFLADTAATEAEFSGPVTLANDAITSVRNNVLSLATISGDISETGGSRSLAVNNLSTWGGTGAILRLTGSNSFTGNVSVGAGVLEFDTVTNAGAGTSALGNGTAISGGAGAATLRFIGSTSQSTNRPITTGAGSFTLSANGTSGAGITYVGPIAVTSTANGSLILLSGATGSEGTISGGITQTGDATDMTVNGGTWTHQTGTSRVADDLTVTGTGTIFNLNSGLFQVRDDLTVTANGVLNLNGAGVLSFSTATISADASLRAASGGTIVLGANNAVVVTDFDGLRIGTDGVGVGTLDTATFSQTVSDFILGNRNLDRSGLVNGSGTITATNNIDLYGGTVNANLGSTGAVTLDKISLNTVTLKGDNSALAGTGATVIIEGTLVLDYTASNTTKVRAASALDMRGSNLELIGNAGAATTQNVASFTLGSGGNSVITLNPGAGQEIVLNLNAITRGVNSQDGTVRFNLPSGTQSATNGITTDTLNLIGSGANAILGGWATVNDGTGTFFARNVPNAANGNIGAAITTLQDIVASWLTGENISDSTGFTGSLGRQFSINSLRFDAVAGSDLLLGSAGHLRLASGGILVTSNVTGTPSITGGTINSSSFALPAAATSNELIITHDSGSIFEIGSSLHLSQNITKSGIGTLRLSGTNQYTGYTEIQNGVLQVSGGSAIGDNSLVTLSATRNSTLQLMDDEAIGRLQGGSRQTDQDLGVVDVGTHTLTINQSGNTTFAGFFTGSGTLIMNAGSTGNLNLTNSSTGFTGDVVVNGGLFQIGGEIARVDAASFTVNKNGNLLLDNNGNSSITTRILDTATITLNSADGAFSGETRPRGFANRENDNVNSTETYGSLVLNSGANYVALEASGGTSVQASLVAAVGWARNNGATINVRGRNLGGTTNERSQFRVANANDAAMIAANVGGGGTIGGTAKNVSIIPWAIGENLTAGLADGNMGNTFLSYVDDRGFVPLHLTNEFSTFGTAAAGDNVRESLGADLTGIAGATVNSLILNNTAFSGLDVTGSGPGQALAITSGALMFTVTGGAASTPYDTTLGGFDNGITVGATNEYVIHVVKPSSAANTSTLTATIASPLISAADITKSGRGTLILNQVNAAGGGSNKTTLNEGTLEIADLDNIGGGTGDLVFAGGTLRLGAGFADDLSTRAIALLNGGATLDTNGNSLVLANSIGGGGAGGFTKIGAGDLTLGAAASYSGPTSFTNGILTLGVSNALPSGTPLILGTGTTNATLDTNGFDQTLGALTVATNSTTLTTTVVIDASNTLTVNGPVLIGANAAPSATLFNATGGGSFVQNQPGGTFQLGGGTGTANTNVATADFSGLANFTANLGPTGVFRVGDNNANSAGSPSTNSTLTLAGTANTITAGILGIGDAQGQGGTATLELGGGTNVINADTVYIGTASASARSGGALIFDGAGGSLTLRGSSGGSSRADIAMTTGTTGTGFNQVNTFLTAGHSVDLRIDTFLMSERTSGTGSVTSTFDFDTGTLDITNLIMSRRSGTGTGDSTSNVSIGGGTATIGTIDMAQSTGTGAGSDSFADLNITGGIVNIGTGSGTAINMANAGTGRAATSTIDLTGGTVNVTGDIVRTGGGGTENATLNLNGATLDMGGNNIGSATNQIAFNAQSGTLQNLGELNGGGDFVKTTAGTLVLAGDNHYTGRTVINAGTLSVSTEQNLGDNPGAFNAAQLEIDDGTLLTTASFTIDDSNRGITIGATGGTIETTAATSLTVAAANPIVLTGALTKTGDGALYVNSTTSGTGTIAITDGTFGGTGTISGNTTIGTGAILTGGTDGTVGTINFNGTLTNNTGATWLIDLVSDVNGSADQINLGIGSLNLNDAALNLVTSGVYTAGYSYTIATYASLAGTFNGLSEGAIISGYQINYGTNAITLTAVPEPGTLGLLGLALGGFFFRRLRKRRNGAVGKE